MIIRVSLPSLNLKFWHLLRNLKLIWKWKSKKTWKRTQGKEIKLSQRKIKIKAHLNLIKMSVIIVKGNDTSLHIVLLLKRMKRQCIWLRVISNPMTMNAQVQMRVRIIILLFLLSYYPNPQNPNSKNFVNSIYWGRKGIWRSSRSIYCFI